VWALGRCAAHHAGSAPPLAQGARSGASLGGFAPGPDPCFELNYLCDDNESINNLTKRYHRDDKSPTGAKPPNIADE
jgi:hypothetical protein